jgi:hypothetical protein
MTDLGELSFQDSVRLTQKTSIFKMIERFDLRDCNPIKTPEAPHCKRDCLYAGESLSDEDTQKYQSINGSLMYAMIVTRPDIVFLLSELSKYVSKLGKIHVVLLNGF